jgi:hypothetical protein
MFKRLRRLFRRRELTAEELEAAAEARKILTELETIKTGMVGGPAGGGPPGEIYGDPRR